MIKSSIITTRPKKATLRITLIALFAALIAGGTFVQIPLPFSPVPIVLQNLFIVLAGLVLGPGLGAATAALYLTAGALGLPVFAGATGGIAHFAGPTGGFLVGYFFAALTAGCIAGRPRAEKNTAFPRILLAAILGFLVVYIPGVIWLLRFTGGSWPKALAAGFFPFIIGDALKTGIAAAAAGRLRRAVAEKLGSSPKDAKQAMPDSSAQLDGSTLDTPPGSQSDGSPLNTPPSPQGEGSPLDTPPSP